MHVSGPSNKGRRKAMNFELNLVPFIDVLSTCICFLLVTAVFINLGRLSREPGRRRQRRENGQADRFGDLEPRRAR